MVKKKLKDWFSIYNRCKKKQKEETFDYDAVWDSGGTKFYKKGNNLYIENKERVIIPEKCLMEFNFNKSSGRKKVMVKEYVRK
ncbi:MAG: hypothetical protein GX092_01705 [Clostridia bacterium]|nr:hypothetical protein [Clostridia bacterium]